MIGVGFSFHLIVFFSVWCTTVIIHLPFPPNFLTGFNFISPYGGQTVTGEVGSSFHFKWSFTAGLRYIQWGLKKTGQNTFETNGILVTIDALGILQLTSRSEYATRVNGTIDVSSGQATFILSNLKRADERFYGAMINPFSGDDLPVFDSVQLVLNGGCKTLFSVHRVFRRTHCYVNSWVIVL